MPVVPSINPNQGGRGAVTMYALDRYKMQSTKQAQVELAVVLTPVSPNIVQAPAQPLPSSIIKTLPTMVTSAVRAQDTLDNSKCSKYQSREADAPNWLCALGAWVTANPLLAMGLIAGTYVMAKGK